MKRLLLLPLLLGFTSAVNAESHNYYLLVKIGYGTWTVPMESMEACEKALNKAMDKKSWVYRNKMATKGGGRGICLTNK
jgi:hypothetical protein